jgi:hypothetical protein
MRLAGESELGQAAEKALSGPAVPLFRDQMQSVSERLAGAEAARSRLLLVQSMSGDPAAVQRELHVFLRECWDAMDGLGRQINLCLQPVFPDSGLLPAAEVTRQCTFYTVRRALRAHEDAAAHPLSRLIWASTREPSTVPCERLSFLCNIAFFVPLPILEGGKFPGQADLPEYLGNVIRPQDVAAIEIMQGMDEMLIWVQQFVGQCYMAMAKVLLERTLEQSGE